MPAMETDAAFSGKQRLARGLAASPGIATGKIVFRSDEARAKADAGEAVILVRIETSAEDVEGMRAAKGILTTRGGLTGDAAIVARILGKPCVAGCTAANVDYVAKTISIAVEDERRATRERVVLHEGQMLTVDGSTGYVYAG
jgi:pyruvate,orthophosphate dikinase